MKRTKKEVKEELKKLGFKIEGNYVILSDRQEKRIAEVEQLIHNFGRKSDVLRVQMDELSVECCFLVEIK